MVRRVRDSLEIERPARLLAIVREREIVELEHVSAPPSALIGDPIAVESNRNSHRHLNDGLRLASDILRI